MAAPKTKAQIKVIQTNLNKQGANLKVDGIMGAKTNAAIAKYSGSGGGGSSGTSSSAKVSTPVKSTTQASSYSKTAVAKNNASIKPSTISKGTISNKKTTSSPFSQLGNFISDAINNVSKIVSKQAPASAVAAYDGYQINPDGNYKPNPNIKPETPFQIIGGGVKNFPTNVKNLVTTPVVNVDKYSTPTKTPDPTALTPGQFGGDITPPVPTPTDTTSGGGTSTTKETQVAPDGTTTTITTPERTLSQTMAESAGTTSDPNSINNANNAILGINSDAKSLQGQGSAWSYDNGQTLINNRVGSWTDNIAKNFNSIQAFDSAYATNPQFKANVDGLSKLGITPDAVKSKIQSSTTMPTNGILPSQTTQDYLANLAGVPKINTGDKTQDSLLTEEALMTQGWTKQQITTYLGDSKTVGILEQDKIDAQKQIDTLTEREEAKEASVREKAQYMIDKATAEWEKADAEAEINRINGKNSLVGLLASLGALDTSSAAGGAITDLDQKYQAKRQDLRTSYNLGVREIQMDMNDKINTLDENLNDNIIKINSDLSKSDREINMEIMKLTYQTNKDMLGYKNEAYKALQARRDKAEAKAKESTMDYYEQFFTVSGAKTFAGLPAEFKNIWKANSGSWLTPAYKGQITGEQVNKSFNQYNIDQGLIDAPAEPMIPMLGPDGIQYSVPQSQVNAFIQDGGKKL